MIISRQLMKLYNVKIRLYEVSTIYVKIRSIFHDFKLVFNGLNDILALNLLIKSNPKKVYHILDLKFGLLFYHPPVQQHVLCAEFEHG